MLTYCQLGLTSPTKLHNLTLSSYTLRWTDARLQRGKFASLAQISYSHRTLTNGGILDLRIPSKSPSSVDRREGRLHFAEVRTVEVQQAGGKDKVVCIRGAAS